MTKTPHVAIIGAGLSGLRCADILTQNGARVTIFEARDRIGGRIVQSKIGDHPIDLGPNWIHGSEDNPISTIAEIKKATLMDFGEGQIVFSPDGKLLDKATVNKVSEFMWTTVDQALEYSKQNEASIPPERSLFDFFQEQVQKTSLTAEEKSMCLEFCRLWGAYIGDPIEKQSLKFFHLEECVDGSNSFVASTYKDIIEYISAPARQRADIRLNQPVVKIETKPRKSHPRQPITLTTESAQSHQFDELVVTCPLGWLKQNQSVFNPALPPRLTQAINNLTYGRLEKVYVTFPRAFWQTDSDSQDPTSNTSEQTKPNPFYTRPTFSHFLNPTYGSHPQEITWNQECLSLSTLPKPHAHPTLLFYTNGPCGAHIVAKLSNLAPSSQEYYNTINNFVHPFYSRLHGYSASSPDCKPTAFVATQWQNDAYAGSGSYTNFQVGLEEGDKDVETIRAGLGAERGLWFAGEHTAPFVALGTTTGAYWSGERVARGIVEAYQLEKTARSKKSGSCTIV